MCDIVIHPPFCPPIFTFFTTQVLLRLCSVYDAEEEYEEEEEYEAEEYEDDEISYIAINDGTEEQEQVLIFGDS